MAEAELGTEKRLMPSAFIDTNILLYCFDEAVPEKREVAKRLVAGLGDELVISTQVLQEFYWNATKKLRMTPPEAKQAVEHFAKRRVVQLSSPMVILSIETSERYRISFWDSLILEAAASAKCSVLYTEDLSHGQSMRGVSVTDPFR